MSSARPGPATGPAIGRKRWYRVLPAALALAGCTMAPNPDALRIEGRLEGPAAGALGAPADWVVELRDDSAERVLGEQRGIVSAQQPPIAFALAIDASRIDPSHRHSLRGAVSVQGQVRWLSEPRPITAPQARVDVGSLRLQPYNHPGGFASTLDCGGHRVTIGYIGQQLRLSDGPRVFDLVAVPGARPYRFELPGDPSTYAIVDAESATVSVLGQVYARCVRVS